jgi:coatomer protein complex subunit alpha (xenin)
MYSQLINILQARKLKAVAERQPTDAIDVEFDTFAEFAICGASHTPIYPGGEPALSCPFDGTQYLAKYRGTVCKVCDVCTVGGGGSGYRVTV